MGACCDDNEEYHTMKGCGTTFQDMEEHAMCRVNTQFNKQLDKEKNPNKSGLEKSRAATEQLSTRR
ncbi:hypothetical protein G9A89_005024 [Geosiphon pyriformis]|nr:hypothetical protein G9A89_005024 [Geosiphon pyriformis]